MKIHTHRITHQTIAGEVIAIDLESGTYFSIRGLGVAIWAWIEAGRTREEIVTAVAHAYPERPDAVSATRSWLDQLLAEGLLVDGVSESRQEVGPLPPAFEPPAFEKFTDMQELIMIDVIHEVDSRRGWPYKPTET